MKDIYQHPTIRRLAAAQPAAPPTAPPAPLEGALADVLAGVVRVDGCRSTAHFFDDLGADSLVMAQFCARVRKRGDLPSVSMKDIYQHPTDPRPGRRRSGRAAPGAGSRPAPRRAPSRPRLRSRRRHRPAPGSTSSCGALQLLVFLGVLLPRRPGHGAGIFDGSRPRPACSTPTCGRSSLGGALFVVPVHAADRRQVGADRSVEAPADPRLEPGVRPVLGRQDAGPGNLLVAVRRARRCTRCTCGRWARRSAGAS